MRNHNIGPKRLVVGAHYGLKDWLAQRVTALVMLVFTFIFLILFFAGNEFSYDSWKDLFSGQFFKLISFVTLLGLGYHAWVGMRDIWMDYVKSVSIRLALQIITILWLVACTGWAIQILWQVQ